MTTQDTLRTLAQKLRSCADLAEIATQTADNLDRLLPLVPWAAMIDHPATAPSTEPSPAATLPVQDPQPSATPGRSRPKRMSRIARATRFVDVVAEAIEAAPEEFTAPELEPIIRKLGHTAEADRCVESSSRIPVALMRFLDSGRIVRTGKKRGNAPIYRHGTRAAVTLTPAQELHAQIRREVDSKIYRPEGD